jgi:hypothetical protein
MTTLTVKINKRSKAGKTFMAMSETFFKDVKGVQIFERKTILNKEKSPYNPEFVASVLKSAKSKNSTTLNPNDIWGSLGLK